MREFLIKLIFVAVVVQPLLDYIAGQRFEIMLGGKYWTPIHLIMIFSLYSWLITWPLEETRNNTKHISLPLKFLILFGMTLVIILVQSLRGLQIGYYSAFGDAETFFWILVTAAMGWSVRINIRKWHNIFMILEKGSIGIALLVIFHTFTSKIIGLQVNGFVHYDALFLVAYGFLVHFVKVSLENNRKNRWRCGLFTIALIIAVNKAIIFSLLIAVPSCVWLLANHTSLNHIKAWKRSNSIGGILIVVVGFILTIYLINPTEIEQYYLNYWQDRVLHGNSTSNIQLQDLSGGRDELWNSSIYWLKENPWFGQGIGFRLLGQLDLALVTNGLSSHNQYLYLLTSLGVPGVSIVSLLLLQYLYITFRSFRQNRLPPTTIILVLPTLGFTLTMLAFGLGGVWNIAPASYILFGLCLGITLQLTLKPRTLKYSHNKESPATLRGRVR